MQQGQLGGAPAGTTPATAGTIPSLKVGEIFGPGGLGAVSQATPFSVDLRSDIGDIPSRSLGPPSVLSAPYTGFTGAGSAPTVGSTPKLGSLASRLADVRSRRSQQPDFFALYEDEVTKEDSQPYADISGYEFDATGDVGEAAAIAADTTGLAAGLTGSFLGKDGGQISFMGMKK